ncbi:MAG: hypothetical protein HY965_03825, partial [Ignavibacteriales bacterium]|nr:hypothetical protein [Ignavibacteriales bacterium]
MQFFQACGFENLILADDGTILQYSSVKDELAALQTGLSCREVSANTQLLLQGNDALDFLHRISTNTLKDLQPKAVKRTLFTNEKGRLLESVLVVHLGDAFLLLGHEQKSKLLLYWLSKYIIADDVVVTNTANDSSLLEFRGEELPALFILLFGDAAKNLRSDIVTLADFNMAPVWIIPDTSSNCGTVYYLWAKNHVMVQILSEWIEHGNMFGFTMVGENAYTQFRLENGLTGSSEIDDRFSPHESGLIDFVSFTKGCYIGQEVIARLDAYKKVQKALRSFIFAEPINAPSMFTLYNLQNEEIGTV